MPRLAELQRTFAAALANNAEACGEIASLVRGDPQSAQVRIAQYRGNAVQSHIRALCGAYSVTRRIVGEQFFEGLARAYARMEPSRSGDLNEFGGRLADFLGQFEPASDLPYLRDVARMEWLVHCASFAADCAPFDIGRLASIPPFRFMGLNIVLAPGCALMSSTWPIARIWEIHQDDHHGSMDVEFDCHAERVLVYRTHWRALARALRPGDYAFLGSAFASETLGEALQTAMEADPEFVPDNVLGHWVQAGVIADLC